MRGSKLRLERTTRRKSSESEKRADGKLTDAEQFNANNAILSVHVMLTVRRFADQAPWSQPFNCLRRQNGESIFQPRKISKVVCQQLGHFCFLSRTSVQPIMHPPAAYTAFLSGFKSGQRFCSIQLDEIHSHGDFTDQCSRIVRQILKANSSASQSGKRLGKRVCPCPLVRLKRFLFDTEIVQRIHQPRRVPIAFHSASRSARTAAETVS